MFLNYHLMEKGFELSYEMPKIYIGCFTDEYRYNSREKTFFKELYSFDFCQIKSV